MNRIKILGYDLLGDDGNDGIRYAWNFDKSRYLLESAAFINKTKGVKGDISGYTTSVGLGCILRQLGCACKFCRTGKLLPFVSLLTAKEIAKQNIFMVLADINCSNHQELKDNKREFAYMGQGEPGFSYSQLRLAIKITDYVMNKLGQSVYRHIISTSGVPEMLYALRNDISTKYFDSRITVHFSLHSLRERNIIMPINDIYPFESSINELKQISEVSGEKVCLGILLFKNFQPDNSKIRFSTQYEDIDKIHSLIGTKHFRLSFCEYNNSNDIGIADIFSKEESNEICEYAKMKGFEAKLFSSFGKSEQSACGMLASKSQIYDASSKWIEQDQYVNNLINEAIMNI